MKRRSSLWVGRGALPANARIKVLEDLREKASSRVGGYRDVKQRYCFSRLGRGWFPRWEEEASIKSNYRRTWEYGIL